MQGKDWEAGIEEDRDHDGAKSADLLERHLKAAITIELSRFRYVSSQSGQEKGLPGHVIEPLTNTVAWMIMDNDTDNDFGGDVVAKNIIKTYLGI